jgi:uncharacterized Ntn-hydrolase superfamily protein
VTFATIALCRRTKKLGVGIATHAPAVGNRCPVVRPRMGAASVQLIADPRQTQLVARLLDLGYSAPKVLQEVQASDPFIKRRQIGIVDSYGNTAAYSGPLDGKHSLHIEGDAFVSMGNGVVSEAVIQAMADAMSSSAEGELSDRLMASIEAGAQAGGQAEGQYSAALLVYGDEPFAELDLRVDYTEGAVTELRRIYDWFRPLVPYYLQRPHDPYLPREDRWRETELARLKAAD